MEVFEGTSESAAAIKLSVVCNNNIKSSLYTASYYCNEGERHARGDVGTAVMIGALGVLLRDIMLLSAFHSCAVTYTTDLT